jgi:DNA-binding transcriptional ArsR family regulator
MPASHTALALLQPAASLQELQLDNVFFALSDPMRRDILMRLEKQALLVGEIAVAYEVSLQAVSRHLQVLVRAGLVRQERTGRISRCRLDAAPMQAAAVWLNQYSEYWQAQFEQLKRALLRLPAVPRQRRKRRAP